MVMFVYVGATLLHPAPQLYDRFTLGLPTRSDLKAASFSRSSCFCSDKGGSERLHSASVESHTY